MASAAKLKVEELRSQLSLRGIDTSGTKPLLVKRLEDALKEEEEEEEEEEEKEKAKAVGVGKKKKRPRGGDEEDGGDEKLRKMSVSELRERAAREGIAVGGLKKAEILERLCEKGADDDADGCEKKVEGEKNEKLAMATKKGGGVLDQWLPEHMKASYHVLQLGEDVYSAILNQTNVGNNNNKFYIIQTLESDDGANFMVYYRWGRVGVRGQDKLQGPYMSKDVATREFQSKFYDKTKNLWHERKDFVSHPKCYTLLEMDYHETEKEAVKVCKPEKSLSGSQHRETKLQPSLAQFISLICNISMMKQQMLEIGYNAEKLPLGKLSKATILKGYDVLKRISAVIGQTGRKQLEQLSSEFYTVIPHDFGFKKMREFVIDTPQKLKSKLEMVEALGQIEIATKILRDDMIEMDDPLYSQYQRLQCELIPVEVDSKEFMMIKKYMLNTHAKTHSGYLVDIVQIFRASRKGESECFQKYSNMKNRMLLWHGSRLTNWTGILSQGGRGGTVGIAYTVQHVYTVILSTTSPSIQFPPTPLHLQNLQSPLICNASTAAHSICNSSWRPFPLHYPVGAHMCTTLSYPSTSPPSHLSLYRPTSFIFPFSPAAALLNTISAADATSIISAAGALSIPILQRRRRPNPTSAAAALINLHRRHLFHGHLPLHRPPIPPSPSQPPSSSSTHQRRPAFNRPTALYSSTSHQQ